jgi:molybdopterin biosynthesis enzyme MoaB
MRNKRHERGPILWRIARAKLADHVYVVREVAGVIRRNGVGNADGRRQACDLRLRLELLCARGELNPHALSGTRT